MNVPSNKWKCHDCTIKQHECMICHKRGKEGDSYLRGKKRVFTFYEQWLRYNDIESYVNTFGNIVIDNDRERYMIDEPVIKCSQYNCGCFYHMSCIKNNPLFNITDNHPCIFRCPHHYCCVCHGNANSTTMMICIKCSKAYHVNCLKNIPYKPLVKKFILCEEHMDEPIKEPKTPKLAKSSKPTRVLRKRTHKKNDEEDNNNDDYLDGLKRQRKDGMIILIEFYIDEQGIVVIPYLEDGMNDNMMVESILPLDVNQEQIIEPSLLSDHDFEL